MRQGDGYKPHGNDSLKNVTPPPGGSTAIPPLLRDGDMTLRDWFAGQLLTSLAVRPLASECKTVASYCYRMADAMIEARRQS